MKLKILITLVTSLFICSNVYAKTSVGFSVFGGTDTANAGFSATITGLSVGNTVMIDVKKDTMPIQTFTEVANRDVISRRFLFDNLTESGTYTFTTSVDGVEIDSQSQRIYIGSGENDGKGRGKISAVFDKSKYTIGETAKLTITLSSVEDYAEGDAVFAVEGLGLTLTTGRGTINGSTAVAEVEIIPTDANLKKVDILASWGQLGYSTKLTIPFNITDVPQTEELVPASEEPAVVAEPMDGEPLVKTFDSTTWVALSTATISAVLILILVIIKRRHST